MIKGIILIVSFIVTVVLLYAIAMDNKQIYCMIGVIGLLAIIPTLIYAIKTFKK